MCGLRNWVGLLAAVVCVSSLPVWAHQGDTVRVSVTTSGRQADRSCYDPSFSPDGRLLAFDSSATNLVPGDANGFADVFIRDMALRTTELISLGPSGEQGNADSYISGQNCVSADGRFVVFISDASNLVPGDTNGCKDVFVRDRVLVTTERVSVATNGDQSDWDSGYFGGPSISADGRFVVFSSSATNLAAGDTNGCDDVFVRDRLLGVTELISVSMTGAPGNRGGGYPCLTADGRLAFFNSYSSDLVPGDTNGSEDVFVRDRVAGTTERVSVTETGGQCKSGSDFVSISPDGRFVAFLNWGSNVVGGDTNGFCDVFVRDRSAGTTERVSVSSGGEQGNDQSGYPCAPAISADGRFVAFCAYASNLVAGDTNGAIDVFVRDRLLGTTIRASVSTEGGQADLDTLYAAIGPDGSSVAFASYAGNLVPDDTNGCPDIFVHQIGPDGGWPTVSGKLAADIGVLPAFATFDLRQPGQTLAVGSWAAAVGADGSFTLPAPVGVFDLSVKVTHWLRRTVANIDTTNGNADAGTLALVNGDVTGDNRVNLLDLSVLLRTWQTTDPMTDLDGNGSVGLGDLSIVLKNFGRLGDQ